jgi:hypothetical protein
MEYLKIRAAYLVDEEIDFSELGIKKQRSFNDCELDHIIIDIKGIMIIEDSLYRGHASIKLANGNSYIVEPSREVIEKFLNKIGHQIHNPWK